MLTTAVTQIETELADALVEARLAHNLAAVADARVFGLIQELCWLVRRQRDEIARLKRRTYDPCNP